VHGNPFDTWRKDGNESMRVFMTLLEHWRTTQRPWTLAKPGAPAETPDARVGWVHIAALLAGHDLLLRFGHRPPAIVETPPITLAGA
jgi:hypothetical protein